MPHFRPMSSSEIHSRHREQVRIRRLARTNRIEFYQHARGRLTELLQRFIRDIRPSCSRRPWPAASAGLASLRPFERFLNRRLHQLQRWSDHRATCSVAALMSFCSTRTRETHHRVRPYERIICNAQAARTLQVIVGHRALVAPPGDPTQIRVRSTFIMRRSVGLGHRNCRFGERLGGLDIARNAPTPRDTLGTAVALGVAQITVSLSTSCMWRSASSIAPLHNSVNA